jgi:hypothetical protein
MEQGDVQGIIKQVVQEFVRQQQSTSEPAYKTELDEERKRREHLEKRVNELVEENKRSQAMTAEVERGAAIRSELQRLGVSKVDLAFKVVQDTIGKTPDGRLIAKTGSGEVGMKEYLAEFISENPEFLPARIPGGAGLAGGQKASAPRETIDIDKIGPTMSAEEKDRVRQEIARLAAQHMR